MDEKYKFFWEKGKYVCSRCKNPLFSSLAKFESGTPWPSFRKAFKGAVEVRKDFSYGREREELVCRKCGQHLGHLFDDGRLIGGVYPKAGLRYCILSESLKFVKSGKR